MKGKWSVTILVVVLAVGLTACGAGSPTVPTIAPAANPTQTPTTAPGANPTSGPAASTTAEVKISGFAFDPPSLTVKVGTTVTWTNQDSAAHTITSDAGDWDSGRLSQGQSFSRTFDQAGTFAYHCSVHPTMKGTIVVTQ